MNGEEVIVQVCATDTISSLRREIANTLEVLMCQLRLTRGSTVLNDAESIGEQSFDNSDTVQVTVMPITFSCADRYPGSNSYVPSSDTDPVPPFPCTFDATCIVENRVCPRHRSILLVKTLAGDCFEIPFGNWEVPLWYKCRLHDLTGIPVSKMRLIYAGCQLTDDRRHSGLQIQSTLHLVLR